MSISGEIMNMVRDLSRRLGNATLENAMASNDESAGIKPAPCDLVETENEFHLTLEMPSFKAGEVDVTAADRRVVVLGKKKGERPCVRHAPVMVERPFGTIHRTVELPCAIDPATLRTRMDQGVLHLTLTKIAPADRPSA